MSVGTPVPLVGYEWTFDPDRSDGGVTVDAIMIDMPEIRPGASLALDMAFWLNDDDPAAPSSGFDAGGTLGGSAGFTLGGAQGATLGTTHVSADPAADDHRARYEAVRDYTEYAGRYASTTTIDGTVRFSEHTPSGATIDSIVVALEPGSELSDTPGLWVILDDVDDLTRFSADVCRISVDATVLARRDEYDTRADIRSALGSDLT